MLSLEAGGGHQNNLEKFRVQSDFDLWYFGVRASLLGTTKRKDGKLEVTYNHHPLYYFVTDRKPGQTTGQGVNQFGGPWWVLSAAGKEIHSRG